MRLAMWLAVLGAAVMCAAARSDTWWVDYDPTAGKYPEEVGWERYASDGGATRFFDPAGALVLDGRASLDISDFYRVPIQDTPSDGERFVLEWSMQYTDLVGLTDPGIGIESSGGGLVLTYGYGGIYSLFEGLYVSDVVSGAHDYAVVSEDMLSYTLYVDGLETYTGGFAPPAFASRVDWGDCFRHGDSSLSIWSYVGVGVVPTPLAGDVNCDGMVDFADINPFVLALTSQAAYQQAYLGCWPENADINGDGSVDFGDINPFIELLTR